VCLLLYLIWLCVESVNTIYRLASQEIEGLDSKYPSSVSAILCSSRPFIHNGFDIKRCFRYEVIGNRAGLNIFCGIMDLGRGLSQRNYDGIVQYIYVSSKKFFEISCKKAIQEEIENNEKEERPKLKY